MSRYIDIVNEGKHRLKEACIADWDTDGFLLFEYVFAMNRTSYLLKQTEENRDLSLETQYFSLIEKRCGKIPLQHITGHQEFMGFDFLVNEHTLVPRQDTEVLVENAIKRIESSGRENETFRILDMCTGSGCIAISLAKLSGGVRITATDISERALETAIKNSRRLSAEQIEFLQGSLFEAVEGSEPFDLIISNPPYIKTAEIDELSEEVRLHDPLCALDGGEDGLYFYREITKQSLSYLKDGGYLMYEIGCHQARKVSEIMKANGFCSIEVIKDMAGLDRVVTGKLHH